MTDEQKQYISLHLDLLKNALKKEGLCFAFLIDKKDFDKSSLVITDVQSIREGKVDGMKISFEKLNLTDSDLTDSTLSGCMIYCEPRNAAVNVEDYIRNKM